MIDLAVRRAREDFIEGMARLGFSLQNDETLGGSISTANASRVVEVRLPPSFPFKSPKVRPVDGSDPMSWHREPDGWLCLYSDGASAALPWLEPAGFLDRVVEWFQRDAAGWPDDSPDLDLERYFPRVRELVVYSDIEKVIGKPIYAKRIGHQVIQVLGSGVAPQGRRPKGVLYGWAADMGELEAPVHNWEEMASILKGQAERWAREILLGRGRFLLLKYSRRGHSAAIALAVCPGLPIELKAFEVADTGQPTVKLRAGRAAPLLAKRSVAIVGIGALGSFVADLLARSGISFMTLQDGKVVRPGNCVRHLADDSYVGMKKAVAVRDILVSRNLLRKEQLQAIEADLESPVQAAQLLERHDLVIDATASSASAILSFVAKTSGRSLVSACIQRDGGIVRCDRWPLKEGESHAPEVPFLESSEPILREGGCGEPVSATPPHAVFEAAAVVVRMVSDLLAGEGSAEPSLVNVLVPQGDAPYDHVGIVR